MADVKLLLVLWYLTVPAVVVDAVDVGKTGGLGLPVPPNVFVGAGGTGGVPSGVFPPSGEAPVDAGVEACVGRPMSKEAASFSSPPARSADSSASSLASLAANISIIVKTAARFSPS